MRTEFDLALGIQQNVAAFYVAVYFAALVQIVETAQRHLANDGNHVLGQRDLANRHQVGHGARAAELLRRARSGAGRRAGGRESRKEMQTRNYQSCSCALRI